MIPFWYCNYIFLYEKDKLSSELEYGKNSLANIIKKHSHISSGVGVQFPLSS